MIDGIKAEQVCSVSISQLHLISHCIQQPPPPSSPPPPLPPPDTLSISLSHSTPPLLLCTHRAVSHGAAVYLKPLSECGGVGGLGATRRQRHARDEARMNLVNSLADSLDAPPFRVA